MSSGRMHAPHANPLDPSLAIMYGNHRKSLAYFSHLAPLILFFLLKGRVTRGGGMAQLNAAAAALLLQNIFELFIVTALTACSFLTKKCAKISAFLCENRNNALAAECEAPSR